MHYFGTNPLGSNPTLAYNGSGTKLPGNCLLDANVVN